MAAQRTDLYDRLPYIWRKLDAHGVLERFLNVVDDDFDSIEQLTDSLLDIHSIDKIPTRHLKLIGDLVGHKWHYNRNLLWNRNRIRDSIRKYSYKGTFVSLNDLVEEHGSHLNKYQDNASKLLILGKQGRLSCDDAYIVAPNYWHDGAYVIGVDRAGETEDLLAALLENSPAGVIWFIEYFFVMAGIDEVVGYLLITSALSYTNCLDGGVGYGSLGITEVVGDRPAPRPHWSYHMVHWNDCDTGGEVLGNTLLGEVPFYPVPTTTYMHTFKSFNWTDIETNEPRIGEQLIGELALSTAPALKPRLDSVEL